MADEIIELPELTDPNDFADYSDRELLEFMAARLQDMAAAVVSVGQQAPPVFEKLANPMVQLGLRAMLK